MSVARGMSLSSRVILAVLVIAVMYSAGGIYCIYGLRWVSEIWIRQFQFGNIGAEFRKACFTTKNIVISSPPPEEQVFLTVRNDFQVCHRNRERDYLNVALRTKNKRQSLRLRKGIEIKASLWNTLSQRKIPLRDRSARWCGAAVYHDVVNFDPHKFFALDVIRYYRTCPAEESSLRGYGGIGKFFIHQVQETAEYHEDNGRSGGPSCRSISKERVPKPLHIAAVSVVFVAAAFLYLCGILFAWRGLETGKPRLLLAAGLFLILGWYATSYLFYLMHMVAIL